ncbi:MAG: hypothetical protein KGL48_13400 [Sphingomonadales bacterium]|nr:hypothetical protein [Sphingomonadales bacterium]MDE2570000.1 hypothetical protein [Sphingomonadales bacterium]
MGHFRAFVMKHHCLAALVVAMALAMKALLPVGYMVGSAGGKSITIEFCDGQPDHALAQVLVPLAGHGDPADDARHKGSSDCPFSALSFGTVGASDAPFVVAAILFVFALAFAALVAAPLPRVRFLSPPLRGPPALS